MGTILQDTRKQETRVEVEPTRAAGRPRRRPFSTALVILSLVGTLILMAGVGVTLTRVQPAGHQSPQAPGGAPGAPAQAAVVNGRVLLGVDGGAGWTDVTPARFGAGDLVAADFLTSEVGWAAAAQATRTATQGLTVYRTGDGGATWKRVAIPWQDEGATNFLDLQFVDARHGWLMVAFKEATSRRAGLLFATSDGGQTWTKLAVLFGGAIRFLDAATGWVVGGGNASARNLIDVTHDGGRTWQAQPILIPTGLELSDRQIGTPAFLSAREGATAVDYGAQVYFYRTGDGGTTWLTTASFPATKVNPMPLPMVAFSGQQGWAFVGGALYGTSDGGQTWAAIRHSANLGNVQAIGRTGAATGWAVVARGYCLSMFLVRCNNTSLLVTSDGGATWAPAVVGQPSQSRG